MAIKILIWCIVIILFAKMKSAASFSDPSINMDMPEIVAYHNYPVEVHTVTTQDGYYLTLHRIPGSNPNKPPVLLQHGNLCTSIIFVLSGPSKALAYNLADQGYDIWMGNFRGTTYSRNHTRYNSDVDDEYWNYSIDELILKDAPAMIDYILEVTRWPKLFYIGHSLGSTMITALASVHPEYNEKVIGAYNLALTFYLKDLRSPLKIITPAVKIIEVVTKTLGISSFFPRDFGPYHSRPCSSSPFMREVCSLLTFLSLGFSNGHFNETLLPAMTSNLPAGASIKLMVHLLQGHEHGKLRRFDYGPDENLLRYHQKQPPEYDLTKFHIPIAIVSGENDLFCSQPDTERVYNEVKTNNPDTWMEVIPGYMHLDYLLAVDSPEHVNYPVLDFFDYLLNR